MKTSSFDWSLRDEVLRISHHWPQTIIAFIFGCLLGWGIAWFWPSPHRAILDLYVGLNIFQTEADHTIPEYEGMSFGNFVDYKDWQMTSLGTLVFTDRVIDPTLNTLQQQNPTWNQISRQALKAMLFTSWRNVGQWRLGAESNDAQIASQAVSAWRDQIVAHVNQAVGESRNLHQLELQIQANNAAIASLLEKIAQLEQLQSILQDRQTKLSLLSEDQPIPEIDRWLVWQTLAQAELGSTWLPLMEAFPPSQAPAKEYSTWVDKAIQALIIELQTVQSQKAAVETENIKLSERYFQTMNNSLGLSTNLDVHITSQDPPIVTKIRPTGLIMLVSGCVSLLAWFIFWFIRLATRKSPPPTVNG